MGGASFRHPGLRCTAEGSLAPRLGKERAVERPPPRTAAQTFPGLLQGKGRPEAGAGRAPGFLPRKAAGGPCSAPALPLFQASAIRRPRAGRGCSQHRPKGPGRGRWEACARGGGTELRPGRSGSSALAGPGHDPRCSLLQVRRRGPPSPAAAAATSSRAGPVCPRRGSAVSPPGSGECPSLCARGAWTALPNPPHSTPSRRRCSSREPQPC